MQDEVSASRQHGDYLLTIARSPSEREFGRLTPVAYDEEMAMQYDGACDYDQTGTKAMTSDEEEIFRGHLSSSTRTYSSPQTSNQVEIQRHAMASNKTDTNMNSNSENTAPTPSATRTVHFNSRQENDRKDVASAFQGFAAQQRRNAESVRMSRARGERDPAEVQALKSFSTNFKLSTPVPKDLAELLAKNPGKQKDIKEKLEGDVKEPRRGSVNDNPGSGDAAENN